jgi:hypothetical protein
MLSIVWPKDDHGSVLYAFYGRNLHRFVISCRGFLCVCLQAVFTRIIQTESIYKKELKCQAEKLGFTDQVVKLKMEGSASPFIERR